jgi:hypothetical protein
MSITNANGEVPILPNDGYDLTRKAGLQSPADIIPHISFKSLQRVGIDSKCDRYLNSFILKQHNYITSILF